MKPGKRVRSEKLGKRLDCLELTIPRGEFLLQTIGKGRPEYGDAFPQMSVLPSEPCNPFVSQIELVSPRAKGVPAEVSVPIPVQVGAVVLLERDAPSGASREPGIFG